MLTNPTPYWFQRQEESIRAILRAGTGNSGPGSAEKVTAIIGLCGLRGHDIRKFRDSQTPPLTRRKAGQNGARPADR
jgi:hypothetical protein